MGIYKQERKQKATRKNIKKNKNENTLSTKIATMKKEKKERKHTLDHKSDQEKRKKEEGGKWKTQIRLKQLALLFLEVYSICLNRQMTQIRLSGG